MVRTELAAVARVGLPLRQRFVVHALLASEQHLALLGREQPQGLERNNRPQPNLHVRYHVIKLVTNARLTQLLEFSKALIK